ncbi:MAG: hypothetical protein ACREOB_12955 [Thermodesulfobacteriota bacterium]
MQVLDYIRIVGISGIEGMSLDVIDVTFNILYSQDSGFTTPRRGVFTLRLSELVDISNSCNRDVENIAFGLIGQVLVREKKEDGSIKVLHLLGMALRDWLINNARTNSKH